MGTQGSEGRLTRREFVRGAGAIAAAGAAIGAGTAQAQEAMHGEMPMRRLGKTDLMVSVASFGSYGLTNPGVLEAALDAGVNLIDTGPGYGEGNAERAIGEVMKRRRDEAIISTKFPQSGPDATKAQMLNGLDGCLQRLQTDAIDVMQIGMAEPGHFGNSAIYEAFAEAKEAGKVRFLGFSTHGDVAGAIRAGLEHDDLAAMVIKYNIMESEGLDEAVTEAAIADVGVVAMKVGAGNREGELAEFVDQTDAEGAKVRWALANEAISSVCCRMVSFEDVAKFVAAVQQPLTEADLDFLQRYRERFASTYCRACSSCVAGCPRAVAVADIMRYRMYFRHYGFEKEAMRLYARLPEERLASACAACDGGCNRACPNGLPTRELMVEAHEMLTLA